MARRRTRKALAASLRDLRQAPGNGETITVGPSVTTTSEFVLTDAVDGMTETLKAPTKAKAAPKAKAKS
jgi:hypothetical protein